MTAMDDPGRKVSEALRARAGQSGLHAFPPGPASRPAAPLPPPGQYAPASPVQQSSMQPAAHPPGAAMTAGHQMSGWETAGSRRPDRTRPRGPMNQVWWALGVALLGGAVLGCALALLSVLVPGLLPALG